MINVLCFLCLITLLLFGLVYLAVNMPDIKSAKDDVIYPDLEDFDDAI